MMLSKTELIPARDRLKEADRHLAYVKGSLKQMKSVEDKRVVNDLVGAIEAQRKAVEQMLHILDTVARSDYRDPRPPEPERPTSESGKIGTSKNRRSSHNFADSEQVFFDVPIQEIRPRRAAR